ncbi:GL21407 [Drosophila persimilis]|uniref:GL21407 n=1 Tax=Drosophila persimilis TaxID=7234 RepID=B4IQV0_DROPE|nr:GL21407 [Drosophila persimilis]
MANFHVLMSNSLTEDRAGPSFAKQQQQQQQEVEQALQAPNANSSVNSFSAVHSKATPMKIGCKFGCLGAGNGQLNAPNGFCLGIDEDIIVADSKNHRIAVYAKMGALKFQFGDAGKRNGQLFYPRKVAVFQHNGNFVVCDRGNGRSRMQIFSKFPSGWKAMKAHGVAVFKDSGEFLYRIGNEGVSCYPTGIDISSAGDLLIGDTHGYRFHVTCYGSDGVFKSVFEFPQLNVSLCCGLKITSEGYVVTLAKNNHQVLVMDLLYV